MAPVPCRHAGGVFEPIHTPPWIRSAPDPCASANAKTAFGFPILQVPNLDIRVYTHSVVNANGDLVVDQVRIDPMCGA
jgi:hypothetical protein